jgi:hypothetical protein
MPTPKQVGRIVEHHLDPAMPNPFRMPTVNAAAITPDGHRVVWET